MSHQSPLISLPRKTTTDTDFSTPLRHAIAHTYGERPDTYAQEIAAVARCRADAVAPGGEDTTSRDLLFKYFGQLELLELRFASEKIAFDWADAFTAKSTVQTSLAFEKASVLHRIASHLSSFACAQSRIDPQGIKRAYTALRQSAGLLSFINENFLHAPSTDLSRPVLVFCASLMQAQAAQVFLEKCINERKPASLASRMSAALAHAYTSLGEESAQFQGKGILDRAWLDVILIKAKYYSSLASWYRATHEHERGEYGNSTSRFVQSVTAAQEANKLAKEFTYTYVPPPNGTLAPDAATALLEITRTHLATAQESKTNAERDNDLIYHALPVPETSLPPVDPLPLGTLATPITIQEIYAAPEVTALIGPDIFRRLVPLEVHEQASVYSEEKAKLVRQETERVESAGEEIKVLLSELAPRQRCEALRKLVAGDEGHGVPAHVKRWSDEVIRREQQEPVGGALRRLEDARRGCRDVLEGLGRELDDESRECERMRVKYTPRWTQQPSATLTRGFRTDLKSHADSLASAQGNDDSIATLWRSIASDIGTLASPNALERAFAQPDGGPVDLLDVDVQPTGLMPDEERQVDEALDEVEASLKRLEAVTSEQQEVLKDFKAKVQADDVSHLLLLNRGRQEGTGGAEPTLFATELEKFKPYQARLGAAVQTRKDVLEDMARTLKRVEAVPGVKRLMRERSGEEKRGKDVEARFRRAWEGYEDVRVGLKKGLEFYNSMNTLLDSLRRDIRAFITSRTSERNRLVAEAETRDRLAGTSQAVRSPPPQNLEDQLAGLRMGSVSPYAAYPTSPPPASPYANPAQAYLPPPPPSRPMAAPSNPYDFSSFGSAGVTSANRAYPAPPPLTNNAGQGYSSPPPVSNGYPSQAPPPSSAYPNHYQSMSPPPPHQSYTASSPYPPPPPPSAYPPPPPQSGYYPPPGQYNGYQPSSGQGYR